MAGPQTLGERAKAAREQLGLSQKEIAQAAGISQPTVWAVEEGETKQSKHLRALALALGQAVEWLEKGLGEMKIHPAHIVREGKPGVKVKVAPVSLDSFRRRAVTIIGTVQVGVWRREQKTQPGERDIITMSVKRLYDGVEVFGFELADRSVDRILPPGVTLQCVRLSDLPEPVHGGDHVIMLNERGDEQQTTCVQLHLEGFTFWAVLNTTDPALLGRAPLELDQNLTNGANHAAYCVIGAFFNMPTR